MAVVSSELLSDGYTSTWTMPRNSIYLINYRVITDDANDGAITVYQDGLTASPNPLPARYANYSYFGEIDVNAKAMVYNFRREAPKESNRWNVGVTYRPLEPGEDPNQDLDNPLARPTIWWVEFNETTEEIFEALLLTDLFASNNLPGKTIGALSQFINSVGDPIADAIQIPRRRVVYVAQKNYATAAEIANLAAKYDNKRNSNVWLGFPAKSMLFRSVQAGQPLFENGAAYYQAVFRFELDKDDFHAIKLPNKGLRYQRIGGGGDATQKFDTDYWTKQKFTQPVWLALNGTQAGPGGEVTVDYEEDNLIVFDTDLPS